MNSRRTAITPEQFESEPIKYIGSAIMPQLHEKIKTAAKREGISLSLFLRRACVERLRKFEQSEQCNG